MKRSNNRASARRIGALAAATGVTADTLRYYEREGLLHPARTAGGFRLYPEEAANCLRFIRQAQQLGLSLREIRQLIQADHCQCADIRRLIAGRLNDVERRLEELESFRRTLRTALERCDRTLSRSKISVCSTRIVRNLS